MSNARDAPKRFAMRERSNPIFFLSYRNQIQSNRGRRLKDCHNGMHLTCVK